MYQPFELEELVGRLVASLVDKTDKINIETKQGNNTVVFSISVDKDDVGKVIGKKGDTLKTIKSLCEKIASKQHKRIQIYVLD